MDGKRFSMKARELLDWKCIRHYHHVTETLFMISASSESDTGLV